MENNAIVSQYATNYGHGASSLPSGLATPTSQVTTAAPEGSVSESVYSQQSLHESTHQPKVKYLGIHPTLRPGAASGCPHIIDLSSIDPSIQQGGLDFADLAATVLYNYDAAVLTSFLDLGKKKFDFRRTDSKTDGGLFFIERRVKFVTIGFLKADGKTIQDAISYRILNEVTGPWAPLSVQGSLCHNVVGQGLMEKYVRGTFAKNVLMQKLWEGKEDVKFVVKTG